MRMFTAAWLDHEAAQRPPGYRETVLALAQRTPDGAYLLPDEALAQLRAQFPPPLQPFHPSTLQPLPPLRAQFHLPGLRSSLVTHHPSLPPLRHRLRTFLAALLQWLRNGCPLTSAALLARRQSICQACPHWCPSAALTPAHCRLCGCATAIKLRDPAATCPDHPPQW